MVNIKTVDDLNSNFEDFIMGKKKGVIKLPVPVANINEWHRETVSPAALLLGISQSEFDKILYYARFAVRDANGDILLMTESEFVEAGYSLKDCYDYIGASAIKKLLDEMTEDDICDFLYKAETRERELMKALEILNTQFKAEDGYPVLARNNTMEPSVAKREDILAELEIVRCRLDAGWHFSRYKTEKLFLDEITLFPETLRTFLKEHIKTRPYVVYHDLAELYGSIVRSCAQYSNIKNSFGYESIMSRNEARGLQESVDALLANGKNHEAKRKWNGNFKVSLRDIIMQEMSLF